VVKWQVFSLLFIFVDGPSLEAVNTRCIYRRLKSSKSDPDNVSMCPILDFANHHPYRQNFVPAPTDADVWDVAPTKKLGDDFKFVAVDNGAIDAGSELFLMYGHHSNRTLFTEYGFVNRFEENSEDDSPPVETFGGEVDVQDVVEELMKSDLKRQADFLQRHLKEAGYWGYVWLQNDLWTRALYERMF